MHPHQLLDHPLFDERPIRHVLEPFGFEINIHAIESPIDPAVDDEDVMDAYAADPRTYIDSLEFPHPAGFTEVYRDEDEDGDIISVAVRAKTVFAQLLLCADSSFAGPNNTSSASYIAVYRERMRQLSTEGFSRERDDEYQHGELAYAAASYAHHAASRVVDNAPAIWPWDKKWWKPTDPRRDLVKAGALILAEIERLDRAAERQGGE
ncbi:hypothetical protein MKP05_09585 [Halomonas sp. EGI 63088]|uniref:Uncharacterized protein n=1 Tax=Halomonas flagellata TaxID=2920385 RepID=A0ABS9RU74_9GAMM|nr:hypothetical protein [Halomonas flagellata]MCH4563380.1 hypothetical protein [Halomonas flagellata]